MDGDYRIRFLDYLQRHWRGYAALVALAATVVVVALLFEPNAAGRQIGYSVTAGILGLLAFQFLTDFKNAQFTAEVLNRHQLSFHIGARLHESHHEVLSRDEAITRFLMKGEVFHLLTSTADDYVLVDKEGYRALCGKLAEGSKVQILLYTPIYHLRSFLDMQSKAGEDNSTLDNDHGRHGQRHRHASQLISEQINTIIPAVEQLMRRFPRRVEVKFFYIKHHVNMAIYGSKRIFAAPLLVGTQGRDLPCLEVFPGLMTTGLYDKLLGEFRYIWEKRNLTFSLQEMKAIYQYLGNETPEYFVNRWIEAAEANDIEQFAHSVIAKRTAVVPAVAGGRQRKAKRDLDGM